MTVYLGGGNDYTNAMTSGSQEPMYNEYRNFTRGEDFHQPLQSAYKPLRKRNQIMDVMGLYNPQKRSAKMNNQGIYNPQAFNPQTAPVNGAMGGGLFGGFDPNTMRTMDFQDRNSDGQDDRYAPGGSWSSTPTGAMGVSPFAGMGGQAMGWNPNPLPVDPQAAETARWEAAGGYNAGVYDAYRQSDPNFQIPGAAPAVPVARPTYSMTNQNDPAFWNTNNTNVGAVLNKQAGITKKTKPNGTVVYTTGGINRKETPYQMPTSTPIKLGPSVGPSVMPAQKPKPKYYR